MTDNTANRTQKVVPIEEQRRKKEGRASVLALLQDSRASARAIQDKKCLLCSAKKLCINKTGLCAACYGTLSPREKKIADREAAHKIVTVIISDDRWSDDA